MKTRRSNNRRTKRNGGGLFDFFFGPPGKAVVYRNGNKNAPPSTTGSFTSTSFSLMPGINYRTITNSQGRTSSGLAGPVPGLIGVAAAVNRFANPPAEGAFGMKGDTTNYSSYPNPYRDLGISAKATNSEIKAAYNSKRATANNTQKKVLNNAYSTLSNTTRRAKYDAEATAFYTSHRPSPANIMKIMSQGSAENQKKASAWKSLGF
jgi:hypothetical protein